MKYLFSFCFLLTASYLFADMPGNKPRPDYEVKISGMQQYADYTFYYQGHDSVAVLHDSSSIHIQGGFGAPMCVNVWAVQPKTNHHTDTLSFCSGEWNSNQAIVLNINDHHLSFTADTTYVKEENSAISYGSVNKIQDAASVKNRNIMYLISGLSLLVLIALVFFVWKKNRKSKNQQS